MGRDWGCGSRCCGSDCASLPLTVARSRAGLRDKDRIGVGVGVGGREEVEVRADATLTAQCVLAGSREPCLCVRWVEWMDGWMGGDRNVGGRLLDDRHVECGAVRMVFL